MCKVEIIAGSITSVQGFKAAGVVAGIKKNELLDLALVYSTAPATAAAVFTTNKVKAAPVLVSMEHIAGGRARAIVVNSGNANACNGEQGLQDARRMADLAADQLQLPAREVLVASTGVIGQNLPMAMLESGIPAVCAALNSNGGSQAARAIMTTDTFPKEVAVQVVIGGQKVTMAGMAKGSGMIHPNMATMLGFLATDANVAAPVLAQALREAVKDTFNMVTVDGDTSTNDCVFLLANGLAGNREISGNGDDYHSFYAALMAACRELARAIAQDGEGATKLVTVVVENATSTDDARKIAKAVAGSSLVKAAVFGSDANWGRIICAAGYAEAEFDPSRVDIYLGEEQVAAGGCGLPFNEERAAAILGQQEVIVRLNLNLGQVTATAWGCDLTYDYVKINGSYRS